MWTGIHWEAFSWTFFSGSIWFSDSKGFIVGAVIRATALIPGMSDSGLIRCRQKRVVGIFNRRICLPAGFKPRLHHSLAA